MSLDELRADRPVGPADAPPGPPAQRARRRELTLAAAAIIAAAAGGAGAAAIHVTGTEARFTSRAATQVNSFHVAVPQTCNRAVDEPKKSTPGLDTASCTMTATNYLTTAETLDLKVDTSSLSNNGKPVEYYDAPPTTKPPKKSATVPDYSENLYITDSNGTHYGFGALTCPTPSGGAHATCSSTATASAAVTLQPGDSVTFTVTVHLNHGGHNGATLTVVLDATDGIPHLAKTTMTFALS